MVLVHGGGPEINAMLKKVGKESRFVNGMRYTDEETMDIVQQVLAGKVNKALVQLLESHHGRAVGLCGLDGGMLKADKLVNGADDYGFVGEIREVNTHVIETATAKWVCAHYCHGGRWVPRRNIQHQCRRGGRPHCGVAGRMQIAADDRRVRPAAG